MKISRRPGKFAHLHVDQREQVRLRRIERIVQIEDPGVDMVQCAKHGRALISWGRKGKGASRITTPLLVVISAKAGTHLPTSDRRTRR